MTGRDLMCSRCLQAEVHTDDWQEAGIIRIESVSLNVSRDYQKGTLMPGESSTPNSVST